MKNQGQRFSPQQITLIFIWSFFSILGSISLTQSFSTHSQLERNTAAVSPVKQSDLLGKFKNWGLVNSQFNSHIQALDAWKIEEGDRKVLVGVVDTGIDTQHEDISPNVWSGKSGPKKVYGWDFVTNQPNPSDEHGHGTHVAGIIGAVTNPKAGISGVAQKVSLMPVRYYSDANPGMVNLRNTIQALNYAIENGAKIINYSGGGPEFSYDEYIALKKAEARGILIVAAAGNERSDTDQKANYYYPAAYGLSNTISVAAINIQNKLLESSNWGKKKVDLVAPGENIYSTLPKQRYGYMSGTSQATAFVTGVAALLLAKNPNLTAHDLKRIILETVDPLPSVKDKVASGGRVNAYRALISLQGSAAPKPLLTDSIGRKPVSIIDSF